MLNERKLTGRELDKRVEAIQGLLSNKRTLVKKYGKDAERVMYGIATKQAKSKVESMNKDKIKELIQQSLEGKKEKPLPKPVAKDLNKIKTNFSDLKKRLKLEDTVDTGFSGRADYGEEDKALGQEDELEMKGLEEAEGSTINLSQSDMDKLHSSGKLDLDGHKLVYKANEVNEALNPEVSQAVNRFIKAMAKRYSYSEQDAVFAIMAALKQRKFDGLNEDLDVGHQDNEPHMLKKELARAGQMVQMLYRAVDKYDGEGEVDFPQWWQAKIIKANSMLDSAFDYLDGEEMVAKIDAMIDNTDEIEVDIDVVNENIPSGNYAKGIEVIKKTLSKEGGAAGLEPLVKELLVLGFKKSDVVKLLKNMISVKKHRDGDYILLPLEEGVIKDMHTFLNDLRDSGVTNMFGAAPYLQDEFGLDKREARQVLSNWMQSFSENLLKEYVDFKDRSRDFQLDSMAQYEFGQDYNQLSMERQLDLIDRLNDIMSENLDERITYDDVLDLRSDKKDLQDRINQLYRDMEQEAEPEGGPIADRYGNELEKLEAKLYRVSKQISDYDELYEGVNEFDDKSMKSYGDAVKTVYGASKSDQLKTAYDAYTKAEKDGDIRGQELALAAIDLINGNINEAMDGGQVFDYFANKGYVVSDRSPDGYPKKEGVEGFQVTDRKDSGRRSDNPQTVIFQYNPSTDQFTISQMSGYKIDQKDAIKAGMREQGMTWAVGIDSYITDGNYNPVNISAEGLKDIVDHVMGGLSREAKAQRDFYADRGPTSGTVDERISTLVKEKLTKSSSVEDHVEDFKDSDAPQFKGKSLKKIKQMALASFLSKQKK